MSSNEILIFHEINYCSFLVKCKIEEFMPNNFYSIQKRISNILLRKQVGYSLTGNVKGAVIKINVTVNQRHR
jgi:hypothetical protein